MKRPILGLITAFIAISFFFIACDKSNNPMMPELKSEGFSLNTPDYIWYEGCGELHSKLMAGKYTEVGEVVVTNDANNLYITFQIKDSEVSKWFISETHLSVTGSLGEVPLTSTGNPQIGLFNYNNHGKTVENNGAAVVFDPIPLNGATELVILAHAVVNNLNSTKCKKPSMEAFNVRLPATAKAKFTYQGEGALSYLITFVSEGGILNGTHQGWCIDTDHYLTLNTDLDVNVISTWDPNFINRTDLVSYPENMDQVNWILNQGFVGTASPNGLGIYTFGDVQKAMWELLEEKEGNSGLGTWSQDRVNEILSASVAGEGFVPKCGQYVGLVLQPFNTNQQITLIPYPVKCYCDETAWAAGEDVGGDSWAMYFEYSVCTE